MTRRYIAIEHNSGCIWGDALAATPEAACTAIAHNAAGTGPLVAFEESFGPIRDCDGGYHLYVAPEDFPEISDGQDQELINRVGAECVHIGDYRPVPAVEKAQMTIYVITESYAGAADPAVSAFLTLESAGEHFRACVVGSATDEDGAWLAGDMTADTDRVIAAKNGVVRITEDCTVALHETVLSD